MTAVSMLGSIPGGRHLIDFMGDLMPAPVLRCEVHGFAFPSRVGLGSGFKTNAATVQAFTRFGFAFIELGLITLNPVLDGGEGLGRNSQSETIDFNDVPINSGLDAFARTCLPSKKPDVPLFIRLAHIPSTSASSAAEELKTMMAKLPPWIDAYVIDSRWSVLDWSVEDLTSYLRTVCGGAAKILISLAPDLSEVDTQRLVSSGLAAGVNGFSVSGGQRDTARNKRVCGRSTKEQSLHQVRQVREWAPSSLLLGSGGVIEPADALAMYEAGADVISLYSGLVFSGPCLAKRINEALTESAMHWNQSESAARVPGSDIGQSLVLRGKDLTATGLIPPSPSSPYSIAAVLNNGWLGLALVGAGLLITGSSAITVALTTVILPYDEAYLGMSRSTMAAFNNHLLPFMSHDRVTYAGCGMSCGLLGIALSLFGARIGQRWAYLAARNSAAFGFASFLLFLGFHYLDPLHALVTLMLLPLFLWGIWKKPVALAMRSSNLYNSKPWRDALTGQFWFVCIGLGLVLAGITICKVGTSTVFVNEDLMFMHTTAHDLLAHNDRLLPAIAHDRAGFGGSLVTAGIAVLITALRGYRQGEGWVWWTLLIAGLPGFVSTLAIHFHIGYTNMFHLLPAYIASFMFAAGLILSYRYLCVEPGVDWSIRRQ